MGDAAREVRTTRVELDSSFELQVGRGSGSRRGGSGGTQVQYHAANMAQSVSGANIEGVREEWFTVEALGLVTEVNSRSRPRACPSYARLLLSFRPRLSESAFVGAHMLVLA